VTTYSTYDAKARFSEILRKVRGGETVLITYRGEEVAEIRPIEKKPSIEEKLRLLKEKGILSGPADPTADFEPLALRPGALARFLEERD
jgi:prevent-host-death family protein